MRVCTYGSPTGVVIGGIFESCQHSCDLVPLHVPPSKIDVSNYDVIVVAGIIPPYSTVIENCRKEGVRVLVGELGHINRPLYWQLSPYLGWLSDDKSEDAFNELGITLHNHSGGDDFMIAGQKPKDSNHGMNAEQLTEMYQGWATKLRALGKGVVFRPHPKGKDIDIDCDRICTRPLANCFAGIGGVLCFNSTFGIDAIIAGVDVYCKKSAAPLYGEYCGSVDDLEAGASITEDKRKELLNRVANSQWTIDDLRSGKALKKMIEVQI